MLLASTQTREISRVPNFVGNESLGWIRESTVCDRFKCRYGIVEEGKAFGLI
jgi:hypothetical protein